MTRTSLATLLRRIADRLAPPTVVAVSTMRLDGKAIARAVVRAQHRGNR